MSNPWAQSFEELRSPYLQEKKAKKDYDGDGKIESGTDEYMGSKDKAIKKAMAMRGKKKVAEHHQKDKDGNTIPHEDGTPSSVEEMKKYGSSNPTGKVDKKTHLKALKKLGDSIPIKKIDTDTDVKTEDVISEADKKGKGSGTKDACYHKVKSRYSVWPSAYASGALVKCRKAGAKNWGNSSKKEEFDYYQMPMKSFDDLVGECWKTHKKVGMKMKGGKMVPDCRPKNEEVAVEDHVKLSGSAQKEYDNLVKMASDKNLDMKKRQGADAALTQGGHSSVLQKMMNDKKVKEEIKITPHDITGGTKAGTDFMSGRKNPKTGKPVYKLSNPGGMRIKLAHYDWKSDLDFVDEALKGKKLEVKETGVKNKVEINPEIKTEAAKAPVKK